MSVLDAALQHLGCAEAEVCAAMAADLLQLINKQRYLQLLASACQLLATLAGLYEPAATHVGQLANKVYFIAESALTAGAAGAAAGATPGSPAPGVAHVPRCVCVMVGGRGR